MFRGGHDEFEVNPSMVRAGSRPPARTMFGCHRSNSSCPSGNNVLESASNCSLSPRKARAFCSDRSVPRVRARRAPTSKTRQVLRDCFTFPFGTRLPLGLQPDPSTTDPGEDLFRALREGRHGPDPCTRAAVGRGSRGIHPPPGSCSSFLKGTRVCIPVIPKKYSSLF